MISFYSVSQEVEPIIRLGPGPSQNGLPTLEPFLKAMDRLQSALEYFEKNNPQSVELENVVCSIYLFNKYSHINFRKCSYRTKLIFFF